VNETESARRGWLTGRTGSGSPGDATLGPQRKGPEHLLALDRVKEWTRERFGLPQDAAIFVSQIACTSPGCPPLETVVAFWTADEKRHHFKIFKQAEEVVCDDLPYVWLKDALAAPEGFESGCC
jgi:nitrate reductase delta subunit